MSVVLDLFGDPVPEHRGKRGRPQHVPTADNRTFVMMMLAAGHSPEDIAASIVPGGISLPTLRKHYFSELMPNATARLRVKGHMLTALAKQATGGNTGAAKELLRKIELEAMSTRPVKPSEAKAEPVGVKELRRREAFDAHQGTSWEDLTQDRLH